MMECLREADSEEFTETGAEQSFLLVFQTKQQARWLQQFGNTITCMDATYKTLRYGFPCFFLLVKTALQIGRVVGTIIPQYETEELIQEGLEKLKEWNPGWSPQFSMTDKSAQELGMVSKLIIDMLCSDKSSYLYWNSTGAFGNVHPNCIRLICDFHTLQAVERWVNCSQHCILPEQKTIVKAGFKNLVYAKTGQLVHAYACHTQVHDVLFVYRGWVWQSFVKITASQWYTINDQLQRYLRNEWLNCKPVSVPHDIPWT